MSLARPEGTRSSIKGRCGLLEALVPLRRCECRVYSNLRRSLNRLTLCQVVAGIVSLLNDYQITNGQPPLGFLNPWLYSEAASAFNDIVKGSNPGCRTLGTLDPSSIWSLSHYHSRLFRSPWLGSSKHSKCHPAFDPVTNYGNRLRD